MALALSLACVVLAVVVYLQHKQSAVDRKEWALERGALLQRIQAPEIAVQQFAERPDRGKPKLIPINDDSAYAEARKVTSGGTD